MLDGRSRASQLTFDDVSPVEGPTTPRRRVYLQVVDVPTTRGDCQGDGVCLALRCRYNTTLEVTKRGGLRINEPGYSGTDRTLVPLRRKANRKRVGLDRFVGNDGFDDRVIAAVERSHRNCALDEVEANPDGMSGDAIAVAMATTRQRIEQIEEHALAKLRLECDRAGITLEDFLTEWIRQ